LLALCSEKPTYLGPFDTVREKMAKLKQDGRIYDNDALLRLLQIVGRQNAVHVSVDDSVVSCIETLKLLLSEGERDDPVVPEALKDHLTAVLDTYDVAVAEDSGETRQLKNYLGRTNRDMRAEIVAFVKDSLSLGKKETLNLTAMLNDLMVWEDLNVLNAELSEQSISNSAVYNAIGFIRTYTHSIVKTFPNIILNGVDYRNARVPSYLGLSRRHTEDIQGFVAKYYASLSTFYKSQVLVRILDRVQESCYTLLMLCNSTPVYSDISYKQRATHSIFDARTTTLLFENYFLRALVEYVHLSQDPSMLVRVEPLDDDGELEPLTEQFAEEQEHAIVYASANTAVQKGNMKYLRQNGAELLMAYLSIIRDHKNTIDFSYDSIMDLVFKTKEREKDTFTDRLKDKSQEERDVDNILKVSKLGVWNKGLQKGLTSYVREDYDDERQFSEDLAQIEAKVMKGKNVDDRNANLYLDDQMEEMDIDRAIEAENDDIGFLTEDYMDGDFEGGEEEDFQDYE